MRGPTLALGVTFAAGMVACSDNQETRTDGGEDARFDVLHRRDSAKDSAGMGDSGYQALGVRCERDASAMPPFPFVAPAPDAGLADGSAEPPHLPQVVTAKGVVAQAPVLVPITFDVDDQRDSIEDFVASMGCTSYWRAFMSDYGVGDAVTGVPIHISETPPAVITDTQIQDWLFSKIKTDSRFPKPDPHYNILYAVFYPAGTSVTANFGTACSSFGGYHSSFPYDPVAVPYAVIPRCGGDLSSLTVVGSHEFYEFASDPTVGGYQQVGDRDVAWSTLFGSEIGDMCEHTSTSQFFPSDYPFALQRGWSNRAAFLGNDPCVPSDGALWFAAAPVVSDVVAVNYGATVMAQGVKLAIGAQTTIDVAMLSNGTTGGWNVEAQDLTQYEGRGSVLSLSLDRTLGQEGDVLRLTIRRTGTNKVYGANPFWLRSTATGQDHVWFGIVGD